MKCILIVRLKRIFQGVGRPFWLFFALVSVAPLVALSVWQQDTGYANNGDFVRSAEFLFSHPQGFSSLYVPAGHPDRDKMFYKGWLDRWVLLPEGPRWKLVREAPIYKSYLAAQVRLTSFSDGGEEVYSITRGAWLSRAILYLTLAICVWRISLYMRGWVVVGLSVALAWLYLESSWVACLSSLYEEQVAILLLPLLAFAVVLHVCRDGEVWVWLILVAVLLIGWSKTAYFYLPALTLLYFISLGFRLSRWFLLLAILVQIVTVRPVLHGEYKYVNPYHSVYFGALVTLSGHELDELSSVGDKPLLRECVGVASYFQGGDKCLRDAKISRGDLLRVIAEKPQVLWRMFNRALREGREIDVAYLGKAKIGGASFAPLAIFNGWKFLFLHGAQYVSMVMLFTGLAVLRGIRHCEDAPLLVSGVFVLLFGWSQYFAALGDGFYEITKHLIIGNYALALGSLFVLFGLACIKPCVCSRAFGNAGN